MVYNYTTFALLGEMGISPKKKGGATFTLFTLLFWD